MRFDLEDEQSFEDFKKRHQHLKVEKGSIGGHISVTFTLTSIGYIPSCKCDICGKSKILKYDL